MTSELVTGMLRVVELCDREEGEIRLVTEIFPPFTDLFKQIWAADKAFALQCMQHYTSWLEGPPNRPTEDEVRSDIVHGMVGLQHASSPSVLSSSCLPVFLCRLADERMYGSVVCVRGM